MDNVQDLIPYFCKNCNSLFFDEQMDRERCKICLRKM